jgi:hypothetical protein
MLQTPPQAPRANAIAERWIGTLRRECLNNILITGPRHLDHVLAEYTAHYSTGHTDPSINGRHQADRTGTGRHDIRHLRRDRLGGLIHEYLQVA